MPTLKMELIQAPHASTKRMILRRTSPRSAEEEALSRANWGAVLLVQGMVAEVLAAADVGVKAANVTAAELWGNCPQHIQTVAFVGPVEAVRQVERALREGGRIG
jgi:hypothetical protein